MYVDDIIITENDMAGISSLKSFLHGQFHTKDLEMLKYFLSVGSYEEQTRNLLISKEICVVFII